jgi:hypothetical protein
MELYEAMLPRSGNSARLLKLEGCFESEDTISQLVSIGQISSE